MVQQLSGWADLVGSEVGADLAAGRATLPPTRAW